ncbi:hypothetical protein [Streptomyces sp. NPDC058434]|uniref:hypothetical protein n=1 Tax=Streptomyces sp. NPDC058434 TaxID=3346498 RepID=UPI0036586A25
MIGAAAFIGFFAVAFLAFAVFVDPRKLWWRFRAPHFEHPEAHEPSTASFTVRRVVMVVLAISLGWQAVGLLRLAGVFETRPDHAEVLDRLESAVGVIETDKNGGRYKVSGREGSWGDFINPLLEGPGHDPYASLVSESGDVERYEVDGICLTVTATPLPGQSETAHAVGTLMYSVKTDVVDSPCT